MIVLRRPATQLTVVAPCSVIVADELTGARNSSNQTYTTSYDYTSNRISVSYNGQMLHPPGDFEQSGDNEITLIYIKPDSRDVLTATYEIDAPLADNQQDVDLIFNTGVWETAGSAYTSLPTGMQIFLNGVKQKEDYYTAVLDSGKVKITFNFITSELDWANLVYIITV